MFFLNYARRVSSGAKTSKYPLLLLGRAMYVMIIKRQDVYHTPFIFFSVAWEGNPTWVTVFE